MKRIQITIKKRKRSSKIREKQMLGPIGTPSVTCVLKKKKKKKKKDW